MHRRRRRRHMRQAHRLRVLRFGRLFRLLAPESAADDVRPHAGSPPRCWPRNRHVRAPAFGSYVTLRSLSLAAALGRRRSRIDDQAG